MTPPHGSPSAACWLPARRKHPPADQPAAGSPAAWWQPGWPPAAGTLLQPRCVRQGPFQYFSIARQTGSCYVLFVTCYLLLVTGYLLLVTCYVLLVACYVLLVTRYLQAIVRPPIIFSRFSAHDFRNPSSTIARSTCTMVALLATDVLCCWSQNASLLLTSLFVLFPLPK